MRALITASVLAIATLLAACGTQQTLTAKPVERRVVAFATLATNACEAETAGPYTALAAARYSAAAKLRAGAITVDAARRVQALGDAARTDLDSACVGGKPDAARLKRAKDNLAAVRGILGN